MGSGEMSPAPWVAQVLADGGAFIWDAGDTMICEVMFAADAGPIAAAPELLAACEMMLECAEFLDTFFGNYRDRTETLRAAVAKARGG